MSEFINQFHLLRPLWLFALLPALVLFVLLLKQRLASARWQGVIDDELMPHVLDQTPTEQERWPLWFVLFAWLIACIGLAGPTWQKIPQPVQKKEDALVLIMDMSLSMGASDVAPDRATRARQKAIDILKQRKEGLTALVVYAGDAYTVTPLTDDADTIINLVPSLSPFIMPSRGSRPDKALAMATELIHSAGLNKAKYLLITDGIQNKDVSRIEKQLNKTKSQLGIITVGTEDGAPVSIPNQGFLRNSAGEIVLPKLDLTPIKSLASTTGSHWYPISYDDSDWQYLIDDSLNQKPEISEREQPKFDLWSDQGYWLIAVVMLIMLFSFRRGWLLTLPLLLVLPSEKSYAFEWQDLWSTKDQQAAKVFDQNPQQAAELFENPQWKASSQYRAGDFEAAANNFNDDESLSDQQRAERLYNKATAQAKNNQLEEALETYQQALELNPEHEDAVFNRDLVEQMLQQQEQQQDQQGDSDNKDQNQDQNKDQQNQDQQGDQNQQDSSDQQQSDSQQNDSQQSDSNNNEQDSQSQNSQNQDSKSEQDQQAQQNAADKSEEQEQQAEQQAQSAQQEQKDQQNAEQQDQSAQAQQEMDSLSREERQALKQWLNRVPDDPGGLLRRKFLYQYQQRGEQQEGEVQW